MPFVHKILQAWLYEVFSCRLAKVILYITKIATCISGSKMMLFELKGMDSFIYANLATSLLNSFQILVNNAFFKKCDPPYENTSYPQKRFLGGLRSL